MLCLKLILTLSKIDEQELSMRMRPKVNGIVGKYARYGEV